MLSYNCDFHKKIKLLWITYVFFSKHSVLHIDLTKKEHFHFIPLKQPANVILSLVFLEFVLESPDQTSLPIVHHKGKQLYWQPYSFGV